MALEGFDISMSLARRVLAYFWTMSSSGLWVGVLNKFVIFTPACWSSEEQHGKLLIVTRKKLREF